MSYSQQLTFIISHVAKTRFMCVICDTFGIDGIELIGIISRHGRTLVESLQKPKGFKDT